MATLRVLGRYTSARGGPFEPGQMLELSDDDAAWYLRDSPGSFAPAGSAAALAPPPVAAAPADEADDDEDDFDPTGAMSTVTASGLVVPDRRGRGGRRRTE